MRFTSSSTIAVRAAAAQPPQRVMALMSACTPALPNGSLPAMRKTLPVLWFWFIMLRTKVRLSFLPHKKRLRGIGRSQEQVKLTLQLLREEHCTLQIPWLYLFTFYLFYLLRWTEDLEEGKSPFGYRGRALHIANTLTLPFYLLPFYLLRGQGGRPEDLEEGNSHFSYWEWEHCTLQIPWLYLFTFYLFTFLPCSYQWTI